MLAWRQDERDSTVTYLSFWYGAARVVAAIGTAARPALPDLRKCAADLGDTSGVFRDAIRRIEFSPR